MSENFPSARFGEKVHEEGRASRGPGPLGDYWKSLSCSGVTPTSLANSGCVGESRVGWRTPGTPEKLPLRCIPSSVWTWRSGC